MASIFRLQKRIFSHIHVCYYMHYITNFYRSKNRMCLSWQKELLQQRTLKHTQNRETLYHTSATIHTHINTRRFACSGHKNIYELNCIYQTSRLVLPSPDEDLYAQIRLKRSKMSNFQVFFKCGDVKLEFCDSNLSTPTLPLHVQDGNNETYYIIFLYA